MRNMPRPEIERPRLKWAARAVSKMDIDILRRTLDLDVAGAVGFEVGHVDFQFLRRDFQHHLPRLRRCLDDGIADAMRAARGEGAHAVRTGIGVGGVDRHKVGRARRSSRRRSAP